MDETGQPYAYTGDNPVSGTDPLGQCTSGSWWCDAAHSIGGGITGVANCLNNSDCFSPRGLANVGAGFANQAAQVLDALICTGTSEQTCPTWSVGTPFPCDSQGSYQVGEAAFLGVGFLLPGGDASDVASVATPGQAATQDLAPLSEDNLGHIFRDASGHLPNDTPGNRLLLQQAVSPENYVGTNSTSGVSTYRMALPNGEQVWVEVRNGVITNGGVNQFPR